MKQTQTFRLARINTPTGTMEFATDDQDRLRVLDWLENDGRTQRLLHRYYKDSAVLKDGTGAHPVTDALAAYVEGDIGAVDTLATEAPGTAFQKDVWAALRAIPAGQTWSYRDLATYIGRPSAVRAVGLANGSNPISVVVPCHRVIGANGSLTGYGGGLPRKLWLLRHEGAMLA
jgi:methylated-DNA-[protein]-cysteine S-methyltransferase